jgi:hypothetical protein
MMIEKINNPWLTSRAYLPYYTVMTNPDKPEKVATKAQRHKEQLLVNIYFLCLGGENVLP